MELINRLRNKASPTRVKAVRVPRTFAQNRTAASVADVRKTGYSRANKNMRKLKMHPASEHKKENHKLVGGWD